MLSTLPVKAAAEIPAALHGVDGGPAHEHAKSSDSGAASKMIPNTRSGMLRNKLLSELMIAAHVGEAHVSALIEVR